MTIRVAVGPDARVERFDRVWCCTGFEPSLARLAWLGRLSERPQCHGRPLVGSTLELAPGCFVTGWLAELSVGPTARNIAGAHHAARLIVEELRGRLTSGEVSAAQLEEAA